MNTYKVTFAEHYVEDYDTLYTYKFQGDLPKRAVVWVDDNAWPGHYLKVRVISKDKQYDAKAEAKYGPLKTLYPDKPVDKSVSARTEL